VQEKQALTALAVLDESTRRNWEFQSTPEPEDEDEDKDKEGFTPDATGLRNISTTTFCRGLRRTSGTSKTKT
jgi:hypothetical protein